jgi:hypothetical protein
MTREEMDTATATLATKSDKIRALHARGLKRREIADYLGLRPQHVGNVVRSYPNGRRRVADSRPPTAAELSAVAIPPGGLSVQAAKLGLAAFFGLPPSAIEIVIRG